MDQDHILQLGGRHDLARHDLFDIRICSFARIRELVDQFSSQVAEFSKPPAGVTIPEPKRIAPANSAPGDAEVLIKYVQYSECFKLVDGKLTEKDINAVYCLNEVMPGCCLHLAVVSCSSYGIFVHRTRQRSILKNVENLSILRRPVVSSS